MELKNFYAQDVNGNIVPGAACTVYLEDRVTLATGLQDAAGAALANPFTADVNGLAQFAAPNGKYYFRCVAGLLDSQIAVQFADPSQIYPLITQAQAAASSASDSANAAQSASSSATAAVASIQPSLDAKADKTALAATGGAYLLGFLKSTAGDRFAQEYSVQDYAVTQANPASLSEAQQALTATPNQGILNWPAKNYSLDQTLLDAGSNSILHLVNGAKFNGAYDSALPGISAGMVEKGFRVRRLRGASSTDVADWWHVRDANYSGGTAGNVNVALTAQTTVRAGATAFEWNFLAKLDNYASGTGENCAAYSQALKRADGSTWADVSELRDYTVDPLTSSVTFEYDLFANGSDANNNRVLLDLVAGKRDAAGARPDISYGIRYRPQAGNSANAFLKFGLDFGGAVDVILHGTGTGTQFALDSGSRAVGLDMSTAVYSIAAIRLPNDSPIVMDASGATSFRYSTTNSRWELRNGANLRAGFSVSTFALFDANAQQVLTNRETGWTAVTGTTDKTSAYNSSWTQTASATYTQSEVTAIATQLALVTKRLGAMQKAQTTHGQIGA